MSLNGANRVYFYLIIPVIEKNIYIFNVSEKTALFLQKRFFSKSVFGFIKSRLGLLFGLFDLPKSERCLKKYVHYRHGVWTVFIIFFFCQLNVPPR